MTQPPPDPAASVPAARSPLLRLLPLALLAAGFAAFFAFGLDRVLSLEALERDRAALAAWVAARPLLSAAGYVAVYCAIIAFSIPAATLLTVAGGFLFGPWLGTALAVAGATSGASLVFLAARTALEPVLRRRAGPKLRALREGFARDALSYLLFLRLVPLFPFWLVNLAPALLGVPLRTFILGTLIGMLPGTFVFAWLGASLSEALDSAGRQGLGALLAPEILVALALLGLLALLPVLLRRWRRRRDGERA